MLEEVGKQGGSGQKHSGDEELEAPGFINFTFLTVTF